VADTKRIMETKRAIRKALQIQVEKKGFAFVEILSPCPTNLGLDPLKAAQWEIEQSEQIFPLGTFRDNSAEAEPRKPAEPKPTPSEFFGGGTEVKAPELVDAIVDLTETGSSLRANNLRILETILTSTTRLIANKKAWANKAKRAKIEQLKMLLVAALEAQKRVLVKLNAPAKKLEKIVAALPALHAPTVNKLNDADWFAVESVVEERQVRDLIPVLSAAGATGIIELPLNKVIF
jgi:ATP phosphoribosyltransferase-like protein